jgi:hypothetical protein
MNRQTTILTAATFAAALGMPALAQQTTPGRTADTVQQQQTQPKQSVEAMDDNAQRSHSRDTAAQPKSPRQQQAGTQRAAADVRDWSAIDKNKDHLIQPEEMEEALKAVGPQAAKK